jgi:hypothetical protein
VGFSLPGFAGKNPGRASPAASFALCGRLASKPFAGALELSDAHLVPAAHVSRNSGRDNPHRVSSPVRSAALERLAPSGYEFTCASRRTSPPADQRSLTGTNSLPELPRIA